MRVEDFQFTDESEVGNSFIKRCFTTIYQQQNVQLNEADKDIEFIFGENNNFHQKSNS